MKTLNDLEPGEHPGSSISVMDANVCVFCNNLRVVAREHIKELVKQSLKHHHGNPETGEGNCLNSGSCDDAGFCVDQNDEIIDWIKLFFNLNEAKE